MHEALHTEKKIRHVAYSRVQMQRFSTLFLTALPKEITEFFS